jgi:Fur family transcriptional regulator, zinc uptake regulator
MTPLATAVLQVVKASSQPISAYAIAARLARQSRKAVHANSVYRCLADLGRSGHVYQLALTKGFVPVPPDHGQNIIWLVCNECHRSMALHGNGCHRLLLQAAKDRGFNAHTFIIELLGQCESCKATELTLPPLPRRQMRGAVAAAGEYPIIVPDTTLFQPSD